MWSRKLTAPVMGLARIMSRSGRPTMRGFAGVPVKPDDRAKNVTTVEYSYVEVESQFSGQAESRSEYVFVLLEYKSEPCPNNYNVLLTDLRKIPAIQDWKIYLQVRQIMVPFFMSRDPRNIRLSSDPSICTSGTSEDYSSTNGLSSTTSQPLQLTVYRTAKVLVFDTRTVLRTIKDAVSCHWCNNYEVMLMNDVDLIPPY